MWLNEEVMPGCRYCPLPFECCSTSPASGVTYILCQHNQWNMDIYWVDINQACIIYCIMLPGKLQKGNCISVSIQLYVYLPVLHFPELSNKPLISERSHFFPLGELKSLPEWSILTIRSGSAILWVPRWTFLTNTGQFIQTWLLNFQWNSDNGHSDLLPSS